MLMNILMAATLWPTMWILCLIIHHSAREKNGMVFGARLKRDDSNGAIIDAITQTYNKRMKYTFIILNLIPVCFFLSKHVSIQFTLWIHWFLIGLVVTSIPFATANKEVIAYKKEHGFMKEPDADEEDIASPQYIELSMVRKVKFIAFLPQMILSLILTVILFFAGSIFHLDQLALSGLEVYKWAVFIYALVTPILYLLARYMDNLSVQVINEDSNINIAYARAKKQIWKNVWLFNSWVNTLVMAVITASALLRFHPFLIFIIASVGEAFLTLFSILDAGKKTNYVEDTYISHKDESFDPEDDRYWICGMFYNNPKDKRSLVSKRFGVGSTFNMASKAGKITNTIAFLALIWIPFMCIWLIMEDFTPMHLVIQEETLVCSHIKQDYSIPLEETEDISLLTKLPEDRFKSMGTATDTMEKGRFSSRELGGNYYTFLKPENHLFLRIDTEDRIYIISGYDDEETQEIYKGLTKE